MAGEKNTFDDIPYLVVELCINQITCFSAPFRINVNHNKISYEDFCIPEITEYIELPEAYIHWIISKTRGSDVTDFHICNFPFVFDASAKTTLLQTDQYFQMHNAQHTAMSEAAFRHFLQVVRINTYSSNSLSTRSMFDKKP